ncbi:MAG: Rrf2 family transcriptional regulator [Gallionella sp.]|nr:Rrf2 family transcriptional regulator [Gallionella sp.]MDD4958760.1 Rrf2 family transcriptional regulator [Gallionella sp.]
MRLTTKGRFAVTAMVDLATRGGKAPVTLGAISERQGISLSYLEQLFGKLRRNEIVASVRGPGGGYCLARPSSKITIADIVTAVDEPLDATGCDSKGDCHKGRPCTTHNLWMGLNETIYAYLAEITLKQVVDGQASCDKSSVVSVNKSTPKVVA